MSQKNAPPPKENPHQKQFFFLNLLVLRSEVEPGQNRICKNWADPLPAPHPQPLRDLLSCGRAPVRESSRPRERGGGSARGALPGPAETRRDAGPRCGRGRGGRGCGLGCAPGPAGNAWPRPRRRRKPGPAGAPDPQSCGVSTGGRDLAAGAPRSRPPRAGRSFPARPPGPGVAPRGRQAPRPLSGPGARAGPGVEARTAEAPAAPLASPGPGPGAPAPAGRGTRGLHAAQRPGDARGPARPGARGLLSAPPAPRPLSSRGGTLRAAPRRRRQDTAAPARLIRGPCAAPF